MGQTLRLHQKADPRRQQRIQRTRGHDQHRAASYRVPQTISGVPKRSQLPHAAMQTQPHGQQFSSNTVPGRGTKHHREHEICRCCSNDQHPYRDICIKDSAELRNAAACQHPQSQHRSRHPAGDAEKEQQHTEKTLFPAKGQQGQ